MVCFYYWRTHKGSACLGPTSLEEIEEKLPEILEKMDRKYDLKEKAINALNTYFGFLSAFNQPLDTFDNDYQEIKAKWVK